MLIDSIRNIAQKPYLLGILSAAFIYAAWLLIDSSGRANLFFLALAGLIGGSLIFSFPAFGAALLAFIVASNITAYQGGIFAFVATATIFGTVARFLIRQQTIVNIPPLIPCAVLLITWHLTTVLWAGSYDQFDFINWFRIVIILLIISWSIETPEQFRLVICFASIGLIVSVVAVVRSYAAYIASGAFAGNVGGMSMKERFFGTWTDPNMMGQSAAPIIALSYSLLRSRVSLPLRILGGTSMFLGLIGILLSQSRGAMLMTLAILIVFIISDKQRKWLFAPMVIALFLIMLFTPIDIFGRFATLWQNRGDSSISQRAEMFWGGIQIAEKYFPFGCGSGNIGTYAADYSLSLRRGIVSHNGYVDLLAEGGPISLTLFLIAIWAAMRELKNMRRAFDFESFEYISHISLAAAGVSIIMVNAFSSYWGYGLIWMILGLISIHPVVFGNRDNLLKPESRLTLNSHINESGSHEHP